MREADSEGYLPVPGGRVWFGRYGTAPVIPVLCLHGGPGMPSYYLEPVTELRDQIPVICYDQLGCGRSARPDNPSLWTLERSLRELDAVTEGLELPRFHLLGHSWGGLLALAYALRRSERVASLVLASPLVSVTDWMADAGNLLADLPEEISAVIRQHEEASTTDSPEYQAAAQFFYQRHLCHLDPWPQVLQRTFDELGEQTYSTMWGPSEFTQTGNLAGVDLTPRLHELSVRSLWTCGSQDEARPSTVRRYAALAPHADFVEFAGGTHCVHLEQPAPFQDTLRDFLVPAGRLLQQ